MIPKSTKIPTFVHDIVFLEVVKPNYQTRTVHILSQFGDLKLDVMIYTG